MEDGGETPQRSGWHVGARPPRFSDPRMQRRAYRRRKIFQILALMLAVSGVIVGMLFWVSPIPRPYLSSLWITQYENRLLPVFHGGEQDRLAILGSRFFPGRVESAFTYQEKRALLADIAAIEMLTEHDPLVVYLSAFAACDPNGRIFLYPGDAHPDNPETRVPLRLVLEAIERSPCPRKLLVLDIMRPVAEARLGILLDNVADQLREELDAVPDPRRLVLSACSPGQVARASQYLGRSVFGYYFEMGLGGRADGAGHAGNKNGQITVRELAAYLADRVDRFASVVYGTRQTPILLGDAGNFALFSPIHGEPEAPPTIPPDSITVPVSSSTGTDASKVASPATASATPKKSDAPPAPGTSANASSAGGTGGNSANAPSPSGSAPTNPMPSAAPNTAIGSAVSGGGPAGASATGATPAAASSTPGASAPGGTNVAEATKSSSPPAGKTATPPPPGTATPARQPAWYARAWNAFLAAPAGAWKKIESYWTTEPPVKRELVYPPWLLEAWRHRDELWDRRVYRVAPLLFRRLEARLLRTENLWRAGVNPEHLREDLAEQRAVIETAMAKVRQWPVPGIGVTERSALFDWNPDPQLVNEVGQFVSQWTLATGEAKPEDIPKIEAKLLAEFANMFPGQQPARIGDAIFEQAIQDPAPTRQKILFLDRMLVTRAATVRDMETIFLTRLAALANNTTDATWNAPVVHRAAQVIKAQMASIMRPDTFDWLQNPIEEAAMQEHDAMACLCAPGYVAPEETARRMNLVSRLASAVEEHRLTLEAGFVESDRALIVLPAYIPYLVHSPINENTWFSALAASQQLREAIVPPNPKLEAGSNELRRRVENVHRLTGPVQSAIDGLLAPFGSDAIHALVQASLQPRVDSSTLDTMEAVLKTPFLRADDRVALWLAATACSGRLIEQVLALDAIDDRTGESESELLSYEGFMDRFRNMENERALRRARTAIALFSMGGVAPTTLQPLKHALQQVDVPNPDRRALAALGESIRVAWAEDLPAQIQAETNLWSKDLLSRVVTPFTYLDVLENPRTNPLILIRTEQAKTLWNWLAQFARYLSHDTPAAAFFSAASNEYERISGPLPPAFHPNFLASFGPATLNVPNPTLVCTVQLVVYGPPSATTIDNFQIIPADDAWLKFTPDTSALDALAKSTDPVRTATIPIQLTLQPGIQGLSVPLPKGFMISVDVAGKTFHYQITFPVPSPFEPDQYQILISADAKGATNPLGEALLRPTGIAEELFLFVRNQTDAPRKILVALQPAGADAVTVETTVSAKSTVPVSFGVEPPKPGTNLPPLEGPIAIRLIDDTDKTTVIAERTFEARIASPRDYVQVTGISFQPTNPVTGAANKLSVGLKARSDIGPPPCMAELIFPPDRIPGLGVVAAGTLRGVLPPPPGILELFGTNIQLAEGDDPSGAVYLNVDGQPRAFVFDVTFARWGDPTSPSLDTEPAIRVNAPAYANPNVNLSVVVQCDNAPPGATADLRLGQYVGGTLAAEIVQALPAPQNQLIGFSPKGATGGLMFQASVSDWNLPLATAGIAGRRYLEARLIEASGNVLATASTWVVLDGHVPERVQFVQLPAKAVKSAPLPLKAMGADTESGIREVSFFFGQPTDGKPPANARTYAGAAQDAAKTIWGVDLPMPAATGPTDITVQFTNNAGLSSFATATLEVVDALPVKNGRVLGSVLEGSIRQPNLTVYLMDPKSKAPDKVIAKVQTTMTGTYAFDNVAPGNYYVFCDKTSTQRQALVPVTVEAGKIANVDLSLVLQPPPKK